MRFLQKYDMRPVMRAVAFAAVMVPLPGCIFVDGTPGSSGEAGGGGAGGGSVLPGGPAPVGCPRVPDWGATTPRELTGPELANANEVCQWTKDLYKARKWNVLFTVQMPSGDIYDYIEVPYTPNDPSPPPGLSDLMLPGGLGILLTEMDLYPGLRGPKETMLRVRPDFSLYISGNTGAASLDEFIAHYLPAGAPAGVNRLYAGISSTNNPKDAPTPNLGASAWIMPYAGTIEPGTLSVLEMAVVCRNTADPTYPPMQMVGVAASRDYANTRFRNFSDPTVRLQVEFYRNGLDSVGPGEGGWAGTVSIDDFHPYPTKDNLIAPGMRLALDPTDVPEFPSLLWLRLWNNRWWVGFNGVWIGWYDATVFTGAFNVNACEVLWYGEVYDSHATLTQWTKTGMGSDHFAADKGGNPSFFGDPMYLDTSETLQWPDKGGLVNPHDDHCYTTTALVDAPALSGFTKTVSVGGPGGKNPACPTPPP